MPKALEDLEKDVQHIDKSLAVLINTQNTTQKQVASLASHVERIIEVSASQADLHQKVEKLTSEVNQLSLAEAKRTGANGAGAWLIQNLPSLATLAAVITFLGGQ